MLKKSKAMFMCTYTVCTCILIHLLFQLWARVPALWRLNWPAAGTRRDNSARWDRQQCQVGQATVPGGTGSSARWDRQQCQAEQVLVSGGTGSRAGWDWYQCQVGQVATIPGRSGNSAKRERQQCKIVLRTRSVPVEIGSCATWDRYHC
jgi:hypothetical protein